MRSAWPVVLFASAATDIPAETRRVILDVVRRFPGLGAADISRQADASLQLSEYHLHALVRAGLMAERSDDGPTVYFALTTDSNVTVDRRDRPLVATLRRPMALRIALQLLEAQSLTMGELAESCGISPATATHHIKRMQRASVVAVDQDGRTRRVALTDADRLRQILIDHPPPRDTVAGFLELWDRLDV